PLVDMSPIIELITSSVAPGTWDVSATSGTVARPDVAGRCAVGSIAPFHLSFSLIIRHTAEVHDQGANRLRLLRRLRYLDQPEKLQAPVSSSVATDAERPVDERGRRFPKPRVSPPARTSAGRHSSVPSAPLGAPTAPGAGEERPKAVQERSERI